MDQYLDILKELSQNINITYGKDCVDVKSILEDIDLDSYPEALIKDLDITKYFDLNVIGYFEASEKIRDKCYPDDVLYVYLMCRKDTSTLVIGLDHLIPSLWPELANITKSELEIIINTYNQKEYINQSELLEKYEWKNVRAFIGSRDMLDNMLDFEQYFTINKFVENFFWGSHWVDFPFRDLVKEKRMRQIELSRMNVYALKDNNSDIINVRTKASKSIVRIENHEGAYIMDITYRPINSNKICYVNNLMNRNYPPDIPLDLLPVLADFHFITHTELIKLEPLTIDMLNLSTIIANNNAMYEELYEEISKFIQKNKSVDDYKEIIYFAENIINTININLKIRNKLKPNDIKTKIESLDKKLSYDNKFKEIFKWLSDILGENISEPTKIYIKNLSNYIINKY